MSVVALRKEWVEVWFGRLDGSPRWFVEHCFDGGKMIVSGRASETEAIADARDFDLPVIRV